jgi:hypothetical protein
MRSWKIRKKHRKMMDSTHSFYRILDQHLTSLDRAFEEIERPSQHDVSAGQSKPAVGHRGAKDEA